MYLDKENVLLLDSNTYRVIEKDPANKIQNKRNLNKNTFSSQNEKTWPRRRTVSFIWSPVYKLSKWVSQVLKFAFKGDD